VPTGHTGQANQAGTEEPDGCRHRYHGNISLAHIELVFYRCTRHSEIDLSAPTVSTSVTMALSFVVAVAQFQVDQ
jgi:hypothetical protein